MDFLVNWIPDLWGVQASWGQTWLIGLLVIFCLGVVVSGIFFEEAKGDRERGPMTLCLMTTCGVVAAFWPMLLIALPFILVVASLFYGGVYLAQSLEEAARVRALERRDD